MRLIAVVCLRLGEQKERQRNLLACLHALNDQTLPRSAYEVWVCEEGPAPAARALVGWGVDRYLFRWSDRPFNRARALNEGAHAAHAHPADWLCLMDADLLVDWHWMERLGTVAAQAQGLVLPYDTVAYLTETSTMQAIAARALRAWPAEPLACRRLASGAVGGAVCCAAGLYGQLGGHDEGFVGWGGEDNDFFFRAEALALPARLADVPLLHLAHPRAPRGADYQANLGRLETRHTARLHASGGAAPQTRPWAVSMPAPAPRLAVSGVEQSVSVPVDPTDARLRVLWLGTDRSQRIAAIFDPLRHAFGQRPDVALDVLLRPACIAQQMSERDRRPLVRPERANACDVVVCDAPFAFLSEPWREVSVPVVCLLEDLHGPYVAEYAPQAVEGWPCAGVLVRYRDAARRTFPWLWQRSCVGWLPHCIEPELFHPMGDGLRPLSVLQTGRRTPEVYPFRHALWQALSGQPYYRCVERPEEGTREHAWPVGAAYAQLLSRAVLGLQGCSIYGYPTRKTFEIPACGAVLATDWIDELHDLGFRAGVNCVALDPQGDLRYQVEHWLAQPAVLDAVARAGYELVHARHTTQVRAGELYAWLRALVDGPKGV